MSTAKKSRARRAPLTPERVREAALTLADKEGLEALSMRKLAQALGVEAMSLYNHVAHKEELLDGLVELVVGELEVPQPGGDWRASMRRRALGAHAVLLRHRWATMLLVSRFNIGPKMLRYTNATLGCLRVAGFSWRAADYAWNALDAYTYGFTLQRLNFPLEPKQYPAAAAQFLPLLPAAQLPWLRGLTEEVLAGRQDGVQHLEFGLELLLDGLERLRTSR